MKNLILVLLSLYSLTALASPEQTVTVPLKVTDRGFEPAQADVPSGREVVLKVTRTTDETCAKSILVPAKKIKAGLPLNKEVTIPIGKLDKGEIRFTCGMNMMGGVISAK